MILLSYTDYRIAIDLCPKNTGILINSIVHDSLKIFFNAWHICNSICCIIKYISNRRRFPLRTKPSLAILRI